MTYIGAIDAEALDTYDSYIQHMNVLDRVKNMTMRQEKLEFTSLAKLGPYILNQEPMQLFLAIAAILGLMISAFSCCYGQSSGTMVSMVTPADHEQAAVLAESILGRQIDSLMQTNLEAQARFQAQLEENVRNQAQLQAEHLLLALDRTKTGKSD